MMTTNAETAERLREIYEEITDLLEEAHRLIQGTDNETILYRAESYWIGHITTALGGEHDYIASDAHTLQNTIDEIEALGDA